MLCGAGRVTLNKLDRKPERNDGCVPGVRLGQEEEAMLVYEAPLSAGRLCQR